MYGSDVAIIEVAKRNTERQKNKLLNTKSLVENAFRSGVLKAKSSNDALIEDRPSKDWLSK